MKLFRSLILLVPFFFSLIHGMEEKKQQVPDLRKLDIAQLPVSSPLANISTIALRTFVRDLYKAENLHKCKEACNQFSDEGSKENNSTEFKKLIKHDWEKQFPKNYALAETARLIWRKGLEENYPYILNDNGGEIPQLHADAVEIRTSLEQFRSLANK
jgi:hypothetical protein